MVGGRKSRVEGRESRAERRQPPEWNLKLAKTQAVDQLDHSPCPAVIGCRSHRSRLAMRSFPAGANCAEALRPRTGFNRPHGNSCQIARSFALAKTGHAAFPICAHVPANGLRQMQKDNPLPHNGLTGALKEPDFCGLLGAVAQMPASAAGAAAAYSGVTATSSRQTASKWPAPSVFCSSA
jgi:hypothetical protein